MKTVTIELEEGTSVVWNNLPVASQKLITAKALQGILKGNPYPTGPDQLELAIDLAEAGVDADTISKLSRLDRSVFEGFLR